MVSRPNDQSAQISLEQLRERLLELAEAGGGALSLSESEARSLAYALGRHDDIFRLLQRSRERREAGEDVWEAFATFVGPKPDKRRDSRKYDAQFLAMRYAYLTRQLPEDFLLENGDDHRWAHPPSVKLSRLDALDRVVQEAGFDSRKGAWKCLDGYRKRGARASAKLTPAARLAASVFLLPNLQLPQKPS